MVEGAVRAAEEPQGQGGPVVAADGRVLPERGQVGVVAALVVQGQPPLGVADRPGRRPLVEGGAGHQLVGLDGQVVDAEPQDPLEQGLGAVVAAAELGHGGQAVQHQGQLVRPVEGDAELVGPGEGRLQLRGGEPADGDQGRAQRHLRGQLGQVPLGALGELRQGGQQGLQVPGGLAGALRPSAWVAAACR